MLALPIQSHCISDTCDSFHFTPPASDGVVIGTPYLSSLVIPFDILKRMGSLLLCF